MDTLSCWAKLQQGVVVLGCEAPRFTPDSLRYSFLEGPLF
jgi:hypothetical protein